MHKILSSLFGIGITFGSLLFFFQPSITQLLISQALETFMLKGSSDAVHTIVGGDAGRTIEVTFQTSF